MDRGVCLDGISLSVQIFVLIAIQKLVLLERRRVANLSRQIFVRHRVNTFVQAMVFASIKRRKISFK